MSDESNLRTQPGPFNMKDLTLDVRLDAIIGGTSFDFTGKKLFSVEFFRKSIGFGITDIDIEVNTSLQPTITITFKDLYGNTVFGKTKNNNPDLVELNENDTDFSTLFNWPPPKFLFTFKGFLGKSATWMLNMKKSSVSYEPSDGSYNIKCEFVPNQWGFLSDLPFLYLLAVKSLKKQTLGPADFAKVQTIFDLIKIGKQVEVKTQETTKEFDNLLKQMTLTKSQRFYDALNISKVINYDEVINGQVGNQLVTPFNALTVFTPDSVEGNADINNPEKLRSLAINAANLRRINTFFLLTSQIGGTKPEKITFNDVVVDSNNNGIITVPKVPNVEQNISARLTLISENISHIEEAIKLKTYNSSKAQLEKVTIGEIFKQLAQDSGYIMGRILEAGYLGFHNNQEVRNNPDPTLKLIGKNFPLTLYGKQQEEKPAIPQYLNGGGKVGADIYEMAFVDNFISAISEGIATELISESQASEPVGDNLIKKRINNLEALRPNPYKSSYQSIAENIMIRSGIAAYLTRSPDPNKPGDYRRTGDLGGPDRATNAEDILPLVNADFENITTQTIANLSSDDFLKLKDFCSFWENLLTEDCESLRQADNEGNLSIENSINPYLSSPGSAFGSPSILDYTVVIDKPAGWKGVISDAEVLKGLRVTDLKRVMADIFRPKPGTGTDAANANFIKLDMMQSIKVINNGIAYSKSPIASIKDGYVFVMFDGTNAGKTQQIMSAESDQEIKSDAEEEKKEKNPLGFINLQSPYEKPGDNSSPLLPVVENMNDNRIGLNKLMLLDYSKLVNPNNQFFQQKYSLSGASYFYLLDKLGDPDNPLPNTIPTRNVTLAVAYHPYDSSGNNLLFGPFVGGPAESDSLVQRGYIRAMCIKIKDRLNEIEQKRNQIISDVLGKSSEQRDLLYKQMHVLYQQWEVLIKEDSTNSNDDCRFTGGDTAHDTPGGISTELTKKFSNHENYNMDDKIAGKSISDNVSDNAVENTFLYGYPLNSANQSSQDKINTKNSIINIEALYKPNGNTTILNIIQQICTKNNFIFIPMPGDPGSFNTSEIFGTHPTEKPRVKNFFYVQFVPTPEARTTLSNSNKTTSSIDKANPNLPQGTLEIKFGSTENQIVKSISVDTQESKATAESIVNLQRLVDNENQNKTVTTDCSMLPVMEGRSYRATAEMLGNAQVFPMQFFYLDSIPLFNGLYQIMKVKHTIRPNDMTTSAEGIRMRTDFQNGTFGGIPPVTLETLAGLSATTQLLENTDVSFSKDDFDPNITFGIDETGGSKGSFLSQNTPLVSRKVTLNAEQKINVNKLIQQMITAGITNTMSQAAILSVVYKESTFKPKNENLNYSEKRILEVWPGTPLQSAKDSANNPEKLGNLKYGSKFGNGPSEGYLYRGRGYNQVTFRGNYKKYSDSTGIDFIADPDKLNNPIYAGLVAIAFFKNGMANLSAANLAYYHANSNINSFTALNDAVGAIYHCNAGTGKSISTLQLDTTGGRRKAFEVSEYFYEITKAGKVT